MEAAETLEFERAAALRDQIVAIEKVHEGQKVLHLSGENVDVIALAQQNRDAWVEVFFIRQGKLVGRDNFLMHQDEGDEPAEVVSAFVKQFYSANPYVPRSVLLQYLPDDMEAIERWMRQKRGGAVRLHVPKRGEKRRLVEMVGQNAAQGLEQLTIRRIHESTNNSQAMEELQEALSLPELPRRIECYDISNIQGTNPVGSMVVFEDGKPKPSHYRRFKVKSVGGIDDYSMMREVLTRRFKRLSETRQQQRNSGEDGTGSTGDRGGLGYRAGPGGHRRRQGPSGGGAPGVPGAWD